MSIESIGGPLPEGEGVFEAPQPEDKKKDEAKKTDAEFDKEFDRTLRNAGRLYGYSY